MTAKRLLQEPLLHFLLLGAILFAACNWLPKRASAELGTIVITEAQVEHLATVFAQTWQRPPTPAEVAGLIRDRVREEVLCREAVALGLDRDDTVIRRRLQQKMEFVSEDIAATAEATEADLTQYLISHPDSFRVDPQFTFRQVYLNPDLHRESLAADAAQLLARLNRADANPESAAQGDPILLDDQFTSISSGQVAKQFGEKFASQLSSLATGHWQGPVDSVFGTHLVFISARTEGRLPALAEVRDAVRREWDNARRVEANEKMFQELLKRYTVTVEGAESQKGSKTLAAGQAK